MKEYSMELCGVERTLPFIPINETMAFASFVILGDTELYQHVHQSWRK